MGYFSLVIAYKWTKKFIKEDRSEIFNLAVSLNNVDLSKSYRVYHRVKRYL